MEDRCNIGYGVFHFVGQWRGGALPYSVKKPTTSLAQLTKSLTSIWLMSCSVNAGSVIRGSSITKLSTSEFNSIDKRQPRNDPVSGLRSFNSAISCSPRLSGFLSVIVADVSCVMIRPVMPI